MYRTTNQVQTALASGRKKSKKISNDYLACRYDPLAGHKLTGIPDGMGEYLEIRDFKSTFLLSGTGGLNVVIMPTLPNPILLSRLSNDHTWSINGVNVVSAIVGPSVPTWQMALGQSQAPMSANWNQLIGSSDGITNARIITVGYRLSYVGAASTCNGYTVATPIPIGLDAGPTTNTAAITFTKSDATTPLVQAAQTVRKVVIDLDLPTSSAPVRNSVIARPELGMQGVLKRRVLAQDHTFKPFWEAPCYLDPGVFADSAATTSWLLQPVTAPAGVGAIGYPTVTVLDHDFNAECLSIQTMDGQDTAMLLEIVTCVQFSHAPTWPLIALTSDPVPLDNGVLNADNKMATAAMHADTIVSDKSQDLAAATKAFNDARTKLNQVVSNTKKVSNAGRPPTQPNNSKKPQQKSNSKPKH